MTSGIETPYNKYLQIATAYAAGEKTHAIALRLGISQSTVIRAARRYGCVMRGAPRLGTRAQRLDGGGIKHVDVQQP